MYQPISLFIGLRYLWNTNLPKFKKIILLLSITGISISIAILIIIISIINGFEEHFQKNILSFIPHVIITNQNKFINQSIFPKKILELDIIEKFSHLVNKDVIIKSNSTIAFGEIIGIDITNYENIRNYDIKHVLDLLQPNIHNAIIGKELAKKLDVHIGDQVQLVLLSNNMNHLLKNNAQTNTFKIISIFSTHNDIDHYQILINKQDSINFLNISKNYITGWRLWLKNPLSSNINQIKKFTNTLVVLDWKQQKGEVFNAMMIEKYMIISLFILILIIASLNIFTTLTINTIEKKNSILILKFLGLLDWKIMLIFIIMGSSRAIIGSVLGTIMSIALMTNTHFFQKFIQFFINGSKIPIFLIPSQIFFINIIIILLSIISTFYPAYHTVKLKKDRILSHE